MQPITQMQQRPSLNFDLEPIFRYMDDHPIVPIAMFLFIAVMAVVNYRNQRKKRSSGQDNRRFR